MTTKTMGPWASWVARGLAPTVALLITGCGQGNGNGPGGGQSIPGSATSAGGDLGSGGGQTSGGETAAGGISGSSADGKAGASGTQGKGGTGGSSSGGALTTATTRTSGTATSSGGTAKGGTTAISSGGLVLAGSTTTRVAGGGSAGGTPSSGGTGAAGSGGTTPGSCDPALSADGTYYIAAPKGTGSTCSVAAPCTVSTAIGKLQPGQTVFLRGGTYGSINVSKSGSEAGSIKIAAYPCELPILDPGSVGISGTYVSVQGIVARNSAGGFGNGWTGAGTTNSNGHIEFINCIADMHSRNGIAFYSATGIHIKQCIVAHTGFSTTSSWSSGVNMFGVQGTYKDNIIEQSVAFENADMQKHTDGSGFIVDDIGTGVTFVNNIGFRNGGSCIRLTNTTGTHIINNTCYSNGLDPAATGPGTPDEIFFSSSVTTNGAVLSNNLAVATGQGGDTAAFFGQKGATVSNNVTNNTGTIDFWVDAAGSNPDFHLKASATTVIGQGTASEAPSEDIGFDPKCITKAAPTGTDVQPWWLYSVDYDYIKNIGGVAQCFHPRARAGAVDVGAYAK